MYSVIKDNIEIGIIENPRFIRLQENGTYALCDKKDAQGIAFADTVYHVYGMPEIAREGVESVALEEFDGGERIRQQEQLMNTLLGYDAAADAEEPMETEVTENG